MKFIDLQIAGLEKVEGLVVERVTVEAATANGKTEKKTVVYFGGQKKGLVMNKTNTDRLARHCQQQKGLPAMSYDDEDWVGTKVNLLLTDGKLFGGGRGPTLRIEESKWK